MFYVGILVFFSVLMMMFGCLFDEIKIYISSGLIRTQEVLYDYNADLHGIGIRKPQFTIIFCNKYL